MNYVGSDERSGSDPRRNTTTLQRREGRYLSVTEKYDTVLDLSQLPKTFRSYFVLRSENRLHDLLNGAKLSSSISEIVDSTCDRQAYCT